MNMQIQPHLNIAKRYLSFKCAAPVLQGGSVLGAYQAGVDEAFAQASIHPDWVAMRWPLAELPGLELVSATHIVADLRHGLGKVAHDYLAPPESSHRKGETL